MSNIEKYQEYNFLYDMMMSVLKSNDVKGNISEALSMLKYYLLCDNVILYRKQDNNLYTCFETDNDHTKSIEQITYITNATQSLFTHKPFLSLDLNNEETIHDLKLIYFKTDNYEYVLTFNNLKPDNYHFLMKVVETLQVILKRLELYEDANIDILTGLNNRNSYEKWLQENEHINSALVYGLFDLFRLKYLNDNYSHTLGDTYIKETAKVLKKYWPSTTLEQTKMIPSGHQLYRIGGDEFALVSTVDTLEDATMKANLAAEEVCFLDLGINDKTPLGLNYGLAIHEPSDNIKLTINNADRILSADKKRMYQKYGLDRRR